MSNKLIKKKDRIITMTEQEYADMKRKMTQEIKLEIFDELQRKVTSMQAQALMLSFGLALYERCNFNEDEIEDILACADEKMADFWTLDDFEKFRDYVTRTCGFDVRVPGYADEEPGYKD